MPTTSQQIEDHLRVVSALRDRADVITRCAELVIRTFRNDGRLYLIGNGGSAADAQHIAAELVGRFKRPQRRPLPAVALTTDTSGLTAIGNDCGFEEVFSRPLQALLRPGDVLWALSVSGSSPNILRAVRYAATLAVPVIGFTGQNGSALQELSVICVVAEHRDSDRVQEVHQLAYHIVCGLVEEAFVT